MRLTHVLHQVVAGRVPARPVAVARIVVGVAALIEAIDKFVFDYDTWAAGLLDVPLIAWLPRIGPDVLSLGLAFAVWTTAAAAFALGWHTRVAGSALWLSVLYHLLLDRQFANNHVYFLMLVIGLLVLADSGAALSLDSKRRGERAGVPAWPVVLVAAQLSLMYGWAAVVKVNSSWLAGEVLDRKIIQVLMFDIPTALRPDALFVLLAVITVVVEAVLAVGLWTRYRRPVFTLGLLFHAGIVTTMGNGDGLTAFLSVVGLGVFALTSLALYPLFLGVWPRTVDVMWDMDMPPGLGALMRWATRLDWLAALRIVGSDEDAPREGLVVVTPERRATGFDGLVEILAVLPVSFLWAAVLTLPGVRQLGQRMYQDAVGERVTRTLSPRGSA